MTDPQKHPELVHYTTVDAFRNIHRSRCLWATHYEDLNDSSELQRFRGVVSRFIMPIILKKLIASQTQANGGIEAVASQEATMHAEVLNQNTFGKAGHVGPLICSFCSHADQSYEAKHGLLSQWRGYGIRGGVAIVLDTIAIDKKKRQERDLFSHPVNLIGDVQYDDDEEAIKKEFPDVFDHLPKILDDIYSKQHPTYDNIYLHFVLGSTLTKHHAFQEEQEIRIVVSPRPMDQNSAFYNSADASKPAKTIRYRPKDDGEARYIELFGDDGTPLPIKRVIVGPSKIQNVNHQKVSNVLAGTQVEVVKSESPFLG